MKVYCVRENRKGYRYGKMYMNIIRFGLDILSNYVCIKYYV